MQALKILLHLRLPTSKRWRIRPFKRDAKWTFATMGCTIYGQPILMLKKSPLFYNKCWNFCSVLLISPLYFWFKFNAPSKPLISPLNGTKLWRVLHFFYYQYHDVLKCRFIRKIPDTLGAVLLFYFKWYIHYIELDKYSWKRSMVQNLGRCKMS